jgi:putative metallohydrolase (TIGR04338 family)
MRERDTQRKRAYRAELSVRHNAILMTWDETQTYVDRVMRSKWMRTHHTIAAQRWRLDRIALSDGRRHAHGSRQRIVLPRWARQPLVVLHEIAHAVQDSADTGGRCAWHGWAWAALYLRLVRRFLGTEWYRRLRLAFRSHRVRYTKPRQLSKEARAAASARLAAWRATQATTTLSVA